MACSKVRSSNNRSNLNLTTLRRDALDVSDTHCLQSLSKLQFRFPFFRALTRPVLTQDSEYIHEEYVLAIKKVVLKEVYCYK